VDWIVLGKLYLTGLIGYISIYLIKGMLRLRRRYSLSFGIEDWVEWKDWFIYYLPDTIDEIRWHFKITCIATFVVWAVDMFMEYYLGYSFF
jgi:hypothetical protein